METSRDVKQRADVFSYLSLDVSSDTLEATYALDDRRFVETVTFEGVPSLDRPEVRAVGELWFLLAGLSYYKAGAPPVVDLGETVITGSGRSLLAAALLDGLGEFSYRNDLPLDDVTFVGGHDAPLRPATVDPRRVVTPFGGGIDSVVTVASLPEDLDQSLFVMSPPSGRFAPLEATAALTGRPILRATRTLDGQIVRGDTSFFNGHVPVTAMVTMLAVVAAVADQRGGVVMSNEHSASVPNLVWRGRDINHQWSKSWSAEKLVGDAVAAAVGDGVHVASFLRNRSELWVAERFAALPDYLTTFRSCNRAFAQDVNRRAAHWCGECDKCVFIALVLAPFVPRTQLGAALGVEPTSDPARFEQLRTLVGLGDERKPFECVGDPGECSVALRALADDPAWRDVDNVRQLASLVSTDVSLPELLQPLGESRVPAAWLR